MPDNRNHRGSIPAHNRQNDFCHYKMNSGWSFVIASMILLSILAWPHPKQPFEGPDWHAVASARGAAGADLARHFSRQADELQGDYQINVFTPTGWFRRGNEYGNSPPIDFIEPALTILGEEIRAYGRTCLHRAGLDFILLVGQVEQENGVPLGGRTVGRNIYISIYQNDVDKLRHYIHHEFFHVLYREEDHVHELIWSAFNEEIFSYSNQHAQADVVFSFSLASDNHGFVSPYAMVSAQEDMAETFKLRMTDASLLSDFCKRDPIIRKKVAQLHILLGRWCPELVLPPLTC